LRILFLSSDTGGGHRASAESLAKQFQKHYPGSTYDLLDIWSSDGVWPYRTLVDSYKHLSAHPRQWQFLYHLSNSRPWEIMTDIHSSFMCEQKIRNRLLSYKPDVIVSVHPAMQHTPLKATQRISAETGRKIPFFTVVTDLGSGHCTWFQKNTDKMYVASERIRKLAKRRGRTADERIVMSGLPIRPEFAVQAEKMGDRTSEAGKMYQRRMKETLNMDPDRPMVLIMGGGEGVGSLDKIVDELYFDFVKQGVDATICVICGRNIKLQQGLMTRDWRTVLNGEHKRQKKRHFLKRLFRRNRSRQLEAAMDRSIEYQDYKGKRGSVNVLGLGFVSNMADYMVAADILVSKAGPGTIAEAAAVGLPVMLTSFLPGQEAGNVDFVLENGFGDYISFKQPEEMAQAVTSWLQDESLMRAMSKAARSTGQPTAAENIVLDIGATTHTWMALNGPVNGALR
jgi:1,2-diacylglycerol 3-beta-galactosyltransferase